MYAQLPFVQSELMECFNTEPALDELLADPIAQLLMSSDRVSRATIQQVLAAARGQAERAPGK
jgi:hypothetical protein